MRRSGAWMMVLAGACAIGGCKSPSSHARRDGQANWDEVRARIKYQLAREQFESGRPEETARTALEALALDERFLDAYVLLCRAQIEMADTSSALRTLSAARGAGLDAPVLFYLEGVVAEMSGDPVAALARYRAARQGQPNNADFLAAEVELMVAQGAPDAALQLIKEHARPNENDATLDALAARLAVLVGDVEYADHCYRAASRKASHPLLTLDYALFLMGGERFLEARTQLEPLAVQEGMKDLRGPVHRALGRCYLALSDPAAAYRLLQPYVDREPTDVEAQLLFATAALAEERYQVALRNCRAVLTVQPRNGEALLIEAMAHARQGRMDAAMRSLDGIAPGTPDRAAADALLASMDAKRAVLTEAQPVDPAANSDATRGATAEVARTDD